MPSPIVQKLLESSSPFDLLPPEGRREVQLLLNILRNRGMYIPEEEACVHDTEKWGGGSLTTATFRVWYNKEIHYIWHEWTGNVGFYKRKAYERNNRAQISEMYKMFVRTVTRFGFTIGDFECQNAERVFHDPTQDTHEIKVYLDLEPIVDYDTLSPDAYAHHN